MSFLTTRLLAAAFLPVCSSATNAQETAPAQSVSAVSAPANTALDEALQRLQLPGITINVEERAVDVTSRVVLRHGTLELIACTPDTKVHESILAIEAKPSHVHTALLLMGATPGTPAMMQPINEDQTIFRPIPPSGDLIDVYLILPGDNGQPVERPISDFLVMRDDDDFAFHFPDKDPEEPKKFPTHSFIFAGSHLIGEEGAKRYMADTSGHVITITTFGDELLCLPGFHEHANEALMWQVAADDLPALEAEVILRLRPQRPEPRNEPPTAPDGDPDETQEAPANPPGDPTSG